MQKEGTVPVWLICYANSISFFECRTWTQTYTNTHPHTHTHMNTFYLRQSQYNPNVCRSKYVCNMQMIYLIGWKSANAPNFDAQFIKADVLIDVGDHNFAIVGRFHFNFGITGITVIHHLCRHLYFNFCKTHPQTNWRTEFTAIALLEMQLSLYRRIFYFSLANLIFGTPMSYSNPLLLL